MKATDVSNYTGAIPVPVLEDWRDNYDIGLVIVQAISPPPGYPPGVTRLQLAACETAGMPTDAYFYLWTNSDVHADMRAKLALLEGYIIGRLWLDAEDTAVATSDMRRSAMWAAFQELDLWSSEHGLPTPGLYTGNWWINGYLDGDASEWSDRPLWLAQYDGIDDTDVVTLPKGWTECAVKQYIGSTSLAGVGGIDLNALSESEAARVTGTTPDPPPVEDCDGYITAIAYMGDDLSDRLYDVSMGKKVRAVADEMRRVREQFIGPRN